jgi:hypothetical protein
MKENPIQLEYLKSVLLAQLLLEANESLIFTTQYRQTIKNLINRHILLQRKQCKCRIYRI